MNVRFDNSKNWIAADGRIIPISELETAHLMNILRMFVRKPDVVRSMLVADIDKYCDYHDSRGPWTPDCSDTYDVKKESMYRATTLSPEELTEYAVNSALGNALSSELCERGVNVGNLLTTWKTEDPNDEG